jgi:catechol 2,3-dioxygenase-like lactoylglutathione lyase family enzyme
MSRIKHIAIFCEDAPKLAAFYAEVFGMKVEPGTQGDMWLTDGYLNLALLQRKSAASPAAGINHFGFELDPSERAAVYEKLEQMGLAPADPRGNSTTVRPFVEDASKDPEGNRFDLTTGMRDISEEKARTDARIGGR